MNWSFIKKETHTMATVYQVIGHNTTKCGGNHMVFMIGVYDDIIKARLPSILWVARQTMDIADGDPEVMSRINKLLIDWYDGHSVHPSNYFEYESGGNMVAIQIMAVTINDPISVLILDPME